ncbi:unnamed protein product [Paramecium sonneborni]|uniref:Uncharacterized protein n=1 Tax=Paramecium sonneborni TaxID=65129 RepID=A0A8S1M9G9_9CILI|nr:unnamed protein product [Paramecium sonneborni]
MYLLILSIIWVITVISAQQKINNKEEIIDSYDAVIVKNIINVTVSEMDNKNYFIEKWIDRTRRQIQIYLKIIVQTYNSEQYYDQLVDDQKAKTNYRKFYEDYKAIGTLNSDYLGIAKFVLCAEQFKYCKQDDENTDYEISKQMSKIQ